MQVKLGLRLKYKPAFDPENKYNKGN